MPKTEQDKKMPKTEQDKKEQYYDAVKKVLYCPFCDTKQKMPNPILNSQLSAVLKDFGMRHENCERAYMLGFYD